MSQYGTKDRQIALGRPVDRLTSNFIPVTESGCLIWLGATRGEYGIMRWMGRKRYIHRLMYELHHGPIPRGLLVCHRCDVKLCGQPHHLFTGTHKDNAQDAAMKGKLSFLKGRKQTPEAVEARFKSRRRKSHV